MAEAQSEEVLSSRVTIADHCARGTSSFAQKQYEDAVDHYAKAAELQAEVNGEMAVENADVLFLYGRALFKVAQANSNILGGKAEGQKPKKKNGGEGDSEKIIEMAMDAAKDIATGGKKKEKSPSPSPDGRPIPAKAAFTFTGDENFEDDDEEEGGEEEDDDDNDDLAAAFEVLDLARVLFTRRLEEPQAGEAGLERETEGKGKGKEAQTEKEDSPMVRHIKERLADTHDLLGEICLETERFPSAITDFRSSLTLKEILYPEDDEQISEAHFKLSLALEFASITHTSDETEASGENTEEAQVNQPMRDEAVKELELAIKSTKLKLQNKEIEVASSMNQDDNDLTREKIRDVKGLIVDMEQRLKELRAPPIDLQSVLGIGTNIPTAAGSVLGESSKVEEAKKTATDLTGLVRHKKKPVESELEVTAASTNGKRKAEDEGEGSDSGKKAKVEDAEDS